MLPPPARALSRTAASRTPPQIPCLSQPCLQLSPCTPPRTWCRRFKDCNCSQNEPRTPSSDTRKMPLQLSISSISPAAPPKRTKCHLVGAYQLLETLGRGNFGKVRRAVHIGTGVEYAVKVVKTSVLKQDLPGNLDIRREMSIIRALVHPNIIHLHEVMTSGSSVYLVMDLASGGDFFKYVSTHGRLSETSARKYFRELVVAVDFCHQHGIYHRDLKPENLLLSADGTLKVSDFGFSAMKDHGKPILMTNCGSPHYCAPEVWNGSQEGYDGAKSDAFSVGVILFVLLSGSQPFHDKNEDRLLQKVNRCEVHYPSFLSSDAVDLLKKLIVREPNKRWSLPMVRRHQWFLQGNIDELEIEGIEDNEGYTDDSMRKEKVRAREWCERCRGRMCEGKEMEGKGKGKRENE